jgi:hypothetical protein
MSDRPWIRDCGFDPNRTLPLPSDSPSVSQADSQAKQPAPPQTSFQKGGKSLKDIEQKKEGNQPRGLIHNDPFTGEPSPSSPSESPPRGIITGDPFKTP